MKNFLEFYFTVVDVYHVISFELSKYELQLQSFVVSRFLCCSSGKC